MSEHDIQVGFFDYVDLHIMKKTHPAYEYVFAVPNGGQRHAVVGAKMKAEGQRKGVPDIWCPYITKLFPGFICEVKFKSNKPTPEQVIWLNRMVSQGWFVCVAWSLDALINGFEEYIGM